MSEQPTIHKCGGYPPPPTVVIEAIARVAGFIQQEARLAVAQLASILLGLLLLAILGWLLLRHPLAVLLAAWYFWLLVGVLVALALGWVVLWLRGKPNLPSWRLGAEELRIGDVFQLDGDLAISGDGRRVVVWSKGSRVKFLGREDEGLAFELLYSRGRSGWVGEEQLGLLKRI